MKISVKFEKDGHVLTEYVGDVIDETSLGKFYDDACDLFRRENPSLSLFDGVNSAFDKVE